MSQGRAGGATHRFSSFADYLDVLRKRRRLVLAVTLLVVAVALMAAPFVLPIKKMRKYWRVDRQWSKSLDRRLSRLAKDDFGPESAKVYRSMEEVNSVEVER